MEPQPVEAPVPPPVPVPVQPRRRNQPVIAIVILVTIGILVVGASYAYSAYAVSRLEVSCFTTRTSVSLFAGSVDITLGVYNPSLLSVTGTWEFTLDYGSVVLADTAVFTSPARDTGYARFRFTISLSDALAIATAGDPEVTFREHYSVFIYSFDLVKHGSGGDSSGPSLPEC